MRTLIIVNGFPRAGKDTFVSVARDYCTFSELNSLSYSMIDPVRSGLRNFDIEPNTTPEYRRLLVRVGDALDEYNGFKINQLFELITELPDIDVFFVHCREREMIERIKARIRKDVHVVTVLVDNPEAQKAVEDNRDSYTSTDQDVLNIEYDYSIQNSSTREKFQERTDSLMQRILSDLGFIKERPNGFFQTIQKMFGTSPAG